MAGFTLNLHIGGLCLMVPDLDGPNRRMHVLLPPCDHGGKPHLPVLTYDVALQTEHDLPKGIPERVTFTQGEFDLSSQAHDPPVTRPAAEVVNLTQLFHDFVPRAFLDTSKPGAPVHARVRFAAGTSSVTSCGAGGFWFFPEDPDQIPNAPTHQLPIRALWTMHVPKDFLDITFTAINDSGFSEPPLRLFPRDQVLDVYVFNSPKDQLPDTIPPLNSTMEPGPKEPAEHFKAFYPMTDHTGEALAPKYSHKAAIPPKCFPGGGQPGLDLMCIGAQADPKP